MVYVESRLPTLTARSWTVTALRDSLLSQLGADTRGREVRLYFYAITESGWKEIRGELRRWRSRMEGRRIVAYVGTDHAVTDPEAIRLMVTDGVTVRLMQDYTGVFHPKVVWLLAPRRSLVWIGSNNLTRDGLLRNIEFAALLRSQGTPRKLQRWAKEVHDSSVAFREELVKEYEAERSDYGARLAALGAFTWSRREKASPRKSRRAARLHQIRGISRAQRRGDLIVEVMPRETGQDGKQMQLPMAAATKFFGMKGRVGDTRQITLTPSWTLDPRELTMTIFANHTVRLVIKELDYGDRPCILALRRQRGGSFSFDIVSRSVFPARYRHLIDLCLPPTRRGSRRWGITK